MALHSTTALGRKVGRRPRFLGVWLMLAGLVLNVPLTSAEVAPPREFQVKAVFLYNFAQFVEWPQTAFETADSPVVIGVLGLDPFGGFLDETVHGEKVNGRPLVVRRYRGIGDIQRCHILFISGSEGRKTHDILAAMKGRSVLTVCDWEDLGRRGAMVWFIMERNRVRLRINLDAAKEVGLNISSK